MQYHSLQQQAPAVDFREATIRGQAPDKGLYFPDTIPLINQQIIQSPNLFSKEEIAFQLMLPYVGKTIPASALYDIVAETINFPFPLVPIMKNISSLELFHGPTLAFKDVGARFMSRCLGYFSADFSQKITVLVATSGDTGGAVANGFFGVDGVEVVILYPSGKVSPVQELQLTTCGSNITALEINGTFDDCQAMVKTAFMDARLQEQIMLTSANSINVARWLPQQLYYLIAWQQWEDRKHPPVFAVPSGNFGNLCAGLMAWAGGLPVTKFIAACNINDTVPDYLNGNPYSPKKAVPTLSNAMDVGDPSNFIRIEELLKQQPTNIGDIMAGFTVTDEQTVATMRQVYHQHQYILDPHGAVAYYALENWLQQHTDQKGIVVETAHPVKFPETVANVIGKQVPIPAAIEPLFRLTKKSIPMDASYEVFSNWLLSHAK